MGNLLIVDDEINIIKSIKRILSSNSFPCNCTGVTSGSEALKNIKENDVDVIISDVNMPEMDGIELLTILKSDPKTQYIPVIMLTGNDDVQVKRVALDLGASDFVNKPAETEELLARLRNALRIKSYHDQLKEQNLLLQNKLIQSQKVEIITELAGCIAWDLSNLIKDILSYTRSEVENQDANPGSDGGLNKVISKAEHAAQLIRQIIQLGHGSRPVVKSLDISMAIENGIKLINTVFSENVHIIIENQIGSGNVLIEETQVFQILMNICLSIMKKSQSDQVVIKMSLRDNVISERQDKIARTQSSNFIFLEVESGGLQCSDLESENPYRSENHLSHFENMNLSLSIAKLIVEGVGGKIETDFAHGSQLKVHVYFPLSGSTQILEVMPR